MAETKPDETTPEPNPSEDGISEDDLKKLVGEVVEEKLSSIGEGITGLADAIVEKLTASGTSSEEGLLEKIGGMIDEKLKGISSGGSGNGSKAEPTERVPKLRVF
jgi:hypothetical protein